MSRIIRPKIFIFDNSWTLLYKTAQLNNLATIQLFRSSDPETPSNSTTYYPIIEQIHDGYVQSDDLIRIYQYILSKDANLDLKVFVTEFIRYITQTDATREWIINELNNFSQYLLQTRPRLELWLSDYTQTFNLPISMADDFEYYKEHESKIFIDIMEIQNKYEQVTYIPKLYRSDIDETSIIYEISNITWNNQLPSPEMGDLLFISIECSIHVPCIIYVNDRGEQKCKVYRGKELEKEPPYDIIIPNLTKIHNNIIYMNLWLGDPDGTNPDLIYKPSKESFRLITYNLEKNNLVASVPLIVRGENRHSNEAIFRTRIVKAMSEFNLGDFVQVKQVAEVKILPDTKFFPITRIDDYIFTHFILNHKMFYNSLHIEEVTNPFPLKSKMHIRYRPMFSDVNRSRESTFMLYISNPSTISFSLKRIVVDESQMIRLNNGTNVTVPKGYIYYQIGISQSESLEEIESFLTTFMAILTIYFSSDPMSQLFYIEDIFRYGFKQDDATVNNVLNFFRQGIIYKQNFLKEDEIIQLFNQISPQAPFDTLSEEFKQAFMRASTDTKLEQEIFNMHSFYYRTLPMLAQAPSKTDPVPGSEERTSERKINRLSEQFPDIFVPGYASLGSEIPDIIPLSDPLAEEKKARIESETFFSRNGHNNRTVLSFPREDPKFYFFCLGNDHPFAGVRWNTLENKSKYAYVPLCFAEDQLRKDSNTRFYYGSSKSELIKSANTIKYRPTVSDCRLSPTMRDVFSLRENNEMTEMRRVGIVNPNEPDPNGFIHCVLTAVGDQNYLSLDPSGRRYYVETIRQKLSSSVNLNLVRQELYDSSDDRIKAELDDITKFLDPRLYYRILEELYNINIYVFVQSRDEIDSIEIPRHRYMHIRPKRSGRYSIIIIKYYSPRTMTRVNFPHCELVAEVDRGDDFQKTMIFEPDSDISNICYDILNRTMKDTTWVYTDKFDIYLNMYNQVNYYAIFDIAYNKKKGKTDTPILAQYIDDYGKTRAMVLSVTVGSTSCNMTIIVPPTQPFDAPSISTDKFPLVHYDTANAILGYSNLTGVYQNENCIVGLWYKTVDIKYHTYVPIYPTTTQLISVVTQQPVPVVTMQPINLKFSCVSQQITTPTASSFVQKPQIEIGKVGVSIARIIQLQKMLSITLQLIQWVFNIERFYRKQDTAGQINEFIERTFSEYYIHTEYNYSELGPLLAEINTDEPYESQHIKAMNHIESKSNLVRNGKFVFPDELTRTKFIWEMRRYARLNFDDDVTIARNIRNYYTSYKDFTTPYDLQTGVEIFIGERELNMWLKYRNIRDKPITVLQKITSTIAFEEDPIIYEDDDGKIYIIQNVSTGTFIQAVDVVKKWFLKKQNRGFNYISKKRVKEEKRLRAINQTLTIPIHKIFAVSVSGHLEVIEDNSADQSNFISILSYAKVPPGFTPVDRYAAILQLL